ncbi:MAG: hypothetical protein U1F39_16065 [Steroidobacteraceae bacterium]|mgnify:FL=1
MSDTPKFPWRLDVNDRYREVVGLVIGLSTAALLAPIVLARDFLGISGEIPLVRIMPLSAYVAWILLLLSTFCGIGFHLFSAKWVRLAWEQPASIFRIDLSGTACECWLEVTFWGNVVCFLGGCVATLVCFLNFTPGA